MKNIKELDKKIEETTNRLRDMLRRLFATVASETPNKWELAEVKQSYVDKLKDELRILEEKKLLNNK